jgi:hypothetical protein
MNDDMMMEYLLSMGAMRPEQDELRRRQAMVDALRGNALEPMQGQMIGKHYVGPGLAGAISKLGQGYMAGQQQKSVDSAMTGMNQRQNAMLRDMQERMRRKRMGLTNLSGAMDTTDYGAGY